jgi:hypothetical protein
MADARSSPTTLLPRTVELATLTDRAIPVDAGQRSQRETIMTQRWTIGALTAAGGAFALAAGAAAAADLTVVSWGGAYQDAQREVYFEPFKQATGIDLIEDSWNGGVGAIRAKVEGGGQE